MNEEEFEKEKRKMRITWIVITICIALVAAVISSEYTINVYIKNTLTKDSASTDSSANIDVISKTLKNFRSVIDTLYLGDVDESKVLDETLKGYVNGLGDEYSEYFTKEEWDEFQTVALGNYVGIGVYLSDNEDNNTVIVGVVEGSPAEEAGIKPDDVIVAVDDEMVLGKSSSELSGKLKSDEGTKVKVTVIRNNEYINFDLERRMIKMYHVKGEKLDNNIGYISLNSFDSGCAEEFKTELETLKTQGVDKIIIDLRSNTGGIVDEAVDIAELFVPKDSTIFITENNTKTKKYTKSENDPIIDCPVVVLVNEYSASASEILAGALKDLIDAKIVGKKTYGKGVIQTAMSLTDGSVLKLTTEEYHTPNDTVINKVGISPDYEVEYNSESETDPQLDKAIEVINSLQK